jgi:uncharacterized RDD family membrane protein YckC
VDSHPSEPRWLRLRIGHEVFPLEADRLLIGRSRSCDLRLRPDTVSRLHAVVVRRTDQLFIEDMGSSNGTYLNGTRFTGEQPLHAGDIVRFGTLRAAVEFLDAPIPSPSEDPLLETDYTVGLIDASPAHFGIRLLAAGLDAVLFGIGSLVPLAPFLATRVVERYLQAGPASEQGTRTATALAVGSLVLWALYAFYYVLHGWARRGGTPGLRLLGLRLADTRHQVPIGWGRALLRLLGVVLSTLTLGVGFLLPAFRKDRRALHDLVAGTEVLRRRPDSVDTR